MRRAMSDARCDYIVAAGVPAGNQKFYKLAGRREKRNGRQQKAERAGRMNKGKERATSESRREGCLLAPDAPVAKFREKAFCLEPDVIMSFAYFE